MQDRNNSCPLCGSKLLARVLDDTGDNIICLAYGCEWKTPSRRKEDREILQISSLKENWQ